MARPIVSPRLVNFSVYTERTFPMACAKKPGADLMALGPGKVFIFPQANYNIYLHETRPSKALFQSGCARL